MPHDAAALQPAPPVTRPGRVALHWDMRLFTDFCAEHPPYYREGADGRVFAVLHRLDGTKYAIKQVVLRQRNVTAVLSECRILASLCHPNVVRYHHCWLGPHMTPQSLSDEEVSELDGSSGGSIAAYEGEMLTVTEPSSQVRVPLCLNVQMEFCPQSLRERLDREEWPPFAERSRWAAALLAGLREVHRRGLCHGDLKAANLLLDHEGRLKIADFGMTQIPSYGTDPYSAPEQRESGVPSAAADIYAAGVILLELLYRYGTRMERAEHIAQVKRRAGGDQPTLISRCLCVDACDRPSAGELLRRMGAERWAGGERPPPAGPDLAGASAGPASAAAS